MIDRLRKWLNKPEYVEGVNIYKEIGDDAYFLSLLLKRKDDFNEQHLGLSLRKIYDRLVKGVADFQKPIDVTIPITATAIELTPKKNDTPTNEVESVCLEKANLIYKQLMNKRAVLFGHCSVFPVVSENVASKIEERIVLAMDVLALQYEMDKAYEVLDYVRIHGRLPDVPKAKEIEIPIHELKTARWNLWKSIKRLRVKTLNEKQTQTLADKYELLKKMDDEISKLG